MGVLMFMGFFLSGASEAAAPTPFVRITLTGRDYRRTDITGRDYRRTSITGRAQT